MTETIMQKEALSSALIDRWEATGQKLTALAEEFPEAAYETRPAADLRTIADVLRHVAFWNRYVAEAARGKQADETANELPRAQFATREAILQALKDSTADGVAALKEHSGGLDQEKAGMLLAFIEHTCEHYGQLVVYARLNGIIPPASRTHG